MKKTLSLEITFAGMVIFIASAVAINGGFRPFVNFIIIPVAGMAIIYFLSKYLSDFWAGTLSSILIILAVHYYVQLWAVTIVVFCSFAIIIFTNYMIKNKKWSTFITIIMILLMVIILNILSTKI